MRVATRNTQLAYSAATCQLKISEEGKTALNHATPRHATPRHATPRHATPRHATPRCTTAMPRHAMCYATQCATPRHTVRHATQCATLHITPCQSATPHNAPRHTMSCATLTLSKILKKCQGLSSKLVCFFFCFVILLRGFSGSPLTCPLIDLLTIQKQCHNSTNDRIFNLFFSIPIQLCGLDNLMQLTSKSGFLDDLLKLLVVQRKLHPYLLLPVVASRVHDYDLNTNPTRTPLRLCPPSLDNGVI